MKRRRPVGKAPSIIKNIAAENREERRIKRYHETLVGTVTLQTKIGLAVRGLPQKIGETIGGIASTPNIKICGLIPRHQLGVRPQILGNGDRIQDGANSSRGARIKVIKVIRVIRYTKGIKRSLGERRIGPQMTGRQTKSVKGRRRRRKESGAKVLIPAHASCMCCSPAFVG